MRTHLGSTRKVKKVRYWVSESERDREWVGEKERDREGGRERERENLFNGFWKGLFSGLSIGLVISLSLSLSLSIYLSLTHTHTPRGRTTRGTTTAVPKMLSNRWLTVVSLFFLNF
jgi:hypothetical protein